MKISVKLFAVLREKAGVSALELDLPEGSTADAALAKLGESFPALMHYLGKSACAVNRAYGPSQTVLREGDELALIPPVSGG